MSLEKPQGPSGRVWNSFAVIVLLWLGLIYGYLDRGFDISVSETPPLVALTLGFLAVCPVFLFGGRGVGRWLIGIAVYGIFAGWIMGQRHIDWTVTKPFRRAYAQIQPGMTRAQVESLMKNEFPGKHPKASWSAASASYLLDPNDRRFNAATIFIHMENGLVISAEYFRIE